MNKMITEEISNIEMNIRRINPDFSPDFMDLLYEYIKERFYQDNKNVNDRIPKMTGNRINDITIEGRNIKVPDDNTEVSLKSIAESLSKIANKGIDIYSSCKGTNY